MSRFAVLFLMLLSALASDEIPKGAHMLLRIENSVTTKTARPGDYIYMRTAIPLAVNGRVVIPEGSYVQGVVSFAKRSGRMKGRAEIGIHLETLTLASGKTFKFSPRLSSVESGGGEQKVELKENTVKEGTTRVRDTAQIAITAGSGAAIGGLADQGWKGAGIGAAIGTGVGIGEVLLSRGREVQLSHGTTLDVVFDRVVALE